MIILLLSHFLIVLKIAIFSRFGRCDKVWFFFSGDSHQSVLEIFLKITNQWNITLINQCVNRLHMKQVNAVQWDSFVSVTWWGAYSETIIELLFSKQWNLLLSKVTLGWPTHSPSLGETLSPVRSGSPLGTKFRLS